MPLPIPASVEDISIDWLTQAMGEPVSAVRTERIGIGIGVSSAVYRASLEGAGPPSVVIKLPALDEAAVFTSSILRMYIREVRFYEELAATAPVRVPHSYHGAVDEESSGFVQVIEDMGSMRIVDQNVGMELADAQRAVDALARWHAHYWGGADALVERGTAVALSDPVYPAVLPLVFAEGWEKVNAQMPVDPAVLAVGPSWTEAMPGLLQSLNAAPATVIHGDYRADNILFGPDEEVALLDFQLTGAGSASYDLAYFITQSMSAEEAAAHEVALFDRWRAALVANGVPAESTEGLWDRYREAALFCLVYPIVASRGMDLADERQFALIENMNSRFARVVDQLNLADLL